VHGRAGCASTRRRSRCAETASQTRKLEWRDGKREAQLLKNARLKVSSTCVEDIDWRAGRGLDRHLMTALAEGDWIRHRPCGGLAQRNFLTTGRGTASPRWSALARRAC
jgi:hypothetical protein